MLIFQVDGMGVIMIKATFDDIAVFWYENAAELHQTA